MMAANTSAATLGEPAGVARAVLDVVDAEQPPLRILVGGQAYDIAQGIYDTRQKTWAGWETISRAADKFPTKADLFEAIVVDYWSAGADGGCTPLPARPPRD